MARPRTVVRSVSVVPGAPRRVALLAVPLEVALLGAATTAVTVLEAAVVAAVFLLLRTAAPPFQLLVLWQPLQS